MLGVDAGSSGLRWRAHLADGRVASGRSGPLSGLSFLPGAGDRGEAEARLDRLVASVRAELGSAPLGGIYAGITGLTAGDVAGTAIADRLAAGLEVSAARVAVVDDMTLAYRCAFEPGEGIVVYAGTGSIAVHVTREGTQRRAGGHGYLVDDAGGGFWIGRRALRAVLREADARGEPAEGPLADAVYATLGGRDWPSVRARVYGGGRQQLAALVPAVRDAAAAGDTAAEAIIAAAGHELAGLARRLGGRLQGDSAPREERSSGPADAVPTSPIALLGGVAVGLGELLLGAVRAGLPAGSEIRTVERAPVEAAVRLARDLAATD